MIVSRSTVMREWVVRSTKENLPIEVIRQAIRPIKVVGPLGGRKDMRRTNFPVIENQCTKSGTTEITNTTRKAMITTNARSKSNYTKRPRAPLHGKCQHHTMLFSIGLRTLFFFRCYLVENYT